MVLTVTRAVFNKDYCIEPVNGGTVCPQIYCDVRPHGHIIPHKATARVKLIW